MIESTLQCDSHVMKGVVINFTGNKRTSYYELTSVYGHDTFLLDVNNVGTAVKVHVHV